MPLDLGALFAELDANEAAISRRNVLLGITFLAAPAVIRCSSNLMPVRYRPQKYDKHGFRNWRDYPPSVQEVREWRAGLNRMWDQGIHVSWSAYGFDQIHHMADAEKRFEAMGLL